MKVVIEKQNSAVQLVLFVIIGCLAMGAGYSFAVLKDQQLSLILAGAVILLAGFAAALGRFDPLLIIDESGLFDSRLGVGKILWADIEDVQIQGGYGNRFLSFRINRPEPYLARLRGDKRAKTLFQHDLGFRRFNVDMREIEVNLLDLKAQIDVLIARDRQGRNARVN